MGREPQLQLSIGGSAGEGGGLRFELCTLIPALVVLVIGCLTWVPQSVWAGTKVAGCFQTRSALDLEPILNALQERSTSQYDSTKVRISTIHHNEGRTITSESVVSPHVQVAS